MKRDYYEILGLNKGATEEEIKSAYRKLAAKYHPDVSNDPDANIKMAEINEAYATLKNPEKRANYDEYGFNDLNQANYQSNGNDTRYYYNPNSAYYEYSNGFVYRKNYSYFFKILIRILILFFVIQSIALIIRLVSNSVGYNTNANVTYAFTSNTTLEVTGYSSMSFFEPSNIYRIQSIEIPSTYKYRGYDYSVTSIGSEAFRGCKYLKEVSLTSAIQSIGSYAFYGCTSLETVYYDGSESDFQNIVIADGNANFKNANVVYSIKNV